MTAARFIGSIVLVALMSTLGAVLGFLLQIWLTGVALGFVAFFLASLYLTKKLSLTRTTKQLVAVALTSIPATYGSVVLIWVLTWMVFFQKR